MSITNIICNGEITLVQGVNGLFLCEESWVTQSRKSALPREALNKETIRIRGRKINCVMRRFFPSSSVGDRPAPRGCTSTPDERKVTTI